MNQSISPLQRIADWQAAQAELAALESELAQAMIEYAHTREEPPRQLIIQTERKRERVQVLFEVAMAALDAQSLGRTGHTNFGALS